MVTRLQIVLRILFFCALLLPTLSYSAAWTQAVGSGQVIVNGSYYVSDHSYDQRGKLSLANLYVKKEINPYIEYGLTDDVTLGGSFFLQRAEQQQSGVDYSQMAFSSAEFFVRKKLWENDSWVFSVQPWIKLPGLYEESDFPSFGKKQIDTEIRFLLGKSIHWSLPIKHFNWGEWGNAEYHFMNMEVAVRHHGEVGKEEVRVDPTLGIRLRGDIMLLAQGFATFGVGPAGSQLIQTGNAVNYDVIKIQLSGVKEITEKTSLQLGVFQEVWGRNIGGGAGGLLSLWYRF